MNRLICNQEERVVMDNVTMDDIKGFAYVIMKDRSEYDDECGLEFKDHIKNGEDGLDMKVALEVLRDWDYRIEEV